MKIVEHDADSESGSSTTPSVTAMAVSIPVLIHPNNGSQGKTIRPKGKPLGATPSSDWIYSEVSVPYANSGALAKALKELAEVGNCFMVRGVANVTGPGPHKRNGQQFTYDAAWTVFDLDDIPVEGDEFDIANIRSTIDKLLPGLGQCGGVIQFSSSAGVHPGMLRIRLWVWLTREISGDEAKSLATLAGADRMQLSQSQPIYIANPKFARGAVDPMEGRPRFVPLLGAPLDVSLFDLSPRKPQRVPSDGATGDRAGMVGTTERYRNWKDIKAGYAGGHQHGPSVAARMLFVAENGEEAASRKLMGRLKKKMRKLGCTDQAELDQIKEDVGRLLDKGCGLRHCVGSSTAQLQHKLKKDEPWWGKGGAGKWLRLFPRDAAFTLVRRAFMQPFGDRGALASNLMEYRGVKAATLQMAADRENYVRTWGVLPNATSVKSLDHIAMQPGITWVRAGYGAGKTEKLAAKWDRDLATSTLYICARIRLTGDAAQRLELANYEDVKKIRFTPGANGPGVQRQGADHMAVCVNSIPNKKLQMYADGSVAWPEFIILDEWKAIADSLSTPKIHNAHHEVFEQLAALLAHARHILIMDAGLTQEDVDALEHFLRKTGAGHDVHKYQMPDALGPMAGRRFLFGEPNDIREKFRACKTGILFSDSKTTVEAGGKWTPPPNLPMEFWDEHEEEHPDIEVVKITSERKPSEIFKSPSAFARANLHIAASPVIDTGYSFVDIEHEVFLIAHGIISPEALLQQSARVRNAMEIQVGAFTQFQHATRRVVALRQAIKAQLSTKSINWIDRFVFEREAEKTARMQFGLGILPLMIEAQGSHAINAGAGGNLCRKVSSMGKDEYHAAIAASDTEDALDDGLGAEKVACELTLQYRVRCAADVELAVDWRYSDKLAAVAWGSEGFFDDPDMDTAARRFTQDRGVVLRMIIGYLKMNENRITFKEAGALVAALRKDYPATDLMVPPCGAEEAGKSAIETIRKLLNKIHIKFERAQKGEDYRDIKETTLMVAKRFAGKADPGLAVVWSCNEFLNHYVNAAPVKKWQPAMREVLGEGSWTSQALRPARRRAEAAELLSYLPPGYCRIDGDSVIVDPADWMVEKPPVGRFYSLSVPEVG